MGNESTPDRPSTRDALIHAYREAVGEMAGDQLVARALRGRTLETGPNGRFVIVGLGKAAISMARGVLSVIENATGAVAVHEGEVAKSPFAVHIGGHPIPDERSGLAGHALLETTTKLRADDLAIFLVSGGGSAIAAVPAQGVTMADKAKTVRALLRSGAAIDDVNTVRKHLSAIKGGWLGMHCRSERAVAFILSDVTSGSLDMVASGPTLPDPTTFAEALDVVKKWEAGLPSPVMAHLARGAAGKIQETPKPGNAHLATIEHEVLAAPATLARAAIENLEEESLHGILMPEPIQGDVAAVAAKISTETRAVVSPCVLCFAGEPTVRPPPGSGRGGRMQHLALLLARELAGLRVTVLAAGSDGRDGDTDHAGAVVNGATYQPAAEVVDRALSRFDSASCCAQLGLGIPAWHTGTNLADLVLVAVD